MGRPSQPKYKEPPSAGESYIDYMFGDADWAQGLGVASPEVQEAILEAERTYGPQYDDIMLDRARNVAPELIGLSKDLAPELGQIQADLFTQQRTADIEDVEALGGRATEALRASDPDRLALMEQQRGLTDDLYARAQGVTPQQSRMAQQSAREAFGARGRTLDNASIFAEALGREEFMRQNRQEAQGAGVNLFGMYQQTSADPFQAILGRPAGAMPYAQAAGQQALGIGQGGGPSVFNPDAGVNLAMQNTANQNQYNASMYGADQGAWGAAVGGGLGALGSIGRGWASTF